MLIYVTTTHGLRGPALFEVGLFGGAFASLTFFRSSGRCENSNAIRLNRVACGGEKLPP